MIKMFDSNKKIRNAKNMSIRTEDERENVCTVMPHRLSNAELMINP
jgi:hypothetical protein